MIACPPDAELQAFDAGEVRSEELLIQIAEHLESCDRCLHTLAKLQSTATWYERAANTMDETSRFCDEPECHRAVTLAQAANHDTDLPTVGSFIAEYRIDKTLGVGGMAAVYKAWQPRLNRPVVIKVLQERRAANPLAIAQFEMEMAAIGRLRDPAVATAFDAGVHHGRHFLVMEYVEGEDLARVVGRQKRLSVSTACRVIREVAIGLEHIHARGIIHRDIKPANVMLSATGQVKILDLGIAVQKKAMDDEADSSDDEQSLLGTLDYMSPEQTRPNAPLDARCDIYALGATLFTLLTGEPPLGRRFVTRREQIEAIRHRDPPTVRDLRDDVPAELSAAIAEMLDKDPTQRPHSAREVAELLQPFADDPADCVATCNPFHHLVRIAGVLLLVGVIGLAASFFDDSGSRKDSIVPVATELNEHSSEPPIKSAFDPSKLEPKISWLPGPSRGVLPGIVLSPTQFAGLRRWQVDTRLPRSRVQAVRWSPDGRWLACASDDSHVRVFRREADRIELHCLLPGRQEQRIRSRSLAWHPDGNQLASAAWQSETAIDIWDITSGQRIHELWGSNVGATALAWNVDGTKLAATTPNGRLQIWDSSGLLVSDVPIDGDVARSVAWHPILGIATAGQSGDVQMWDETSMQSRFQLVKTGSPINAIAWRPDGKDLAVVCEDGGMYLWEWNKFDVSRKWSFAGALTDVAWNSDGSRLAAVGRQIVVWTDLAGEPNCEPVESGDDEMIRSASWHPELHQLTVGGPRTSLRTWRSADESSQSWFPAWDTDLLDLAWRPGTSQFAAATRDGSVHLFNRTGQYEQLAVAAESAGFAVEQLAWSPDGRLLAGREVNGTRVRVWDIDAGQLLSELNHACPVNCIAWSPNSDMLVVGDDKGVVQIRNAADGKLIFEGNHHQASVTALSRCEETRRFASSDRSGTVCVWELNDDGTIELPTSWATDHDHIRQIAWSPMPHRLAIADDDRNVSLRDGDSGELLWTTRIVRDGMIAWKPDGNRLVVGGNGMLDAQSGKLQHFDVQELFTLSPNGRWLVYGCWFHELIFLELRNQVRTWMAVPLQGGAAVFRNSGEPMYCPDKSQEQLVYIVEPEPSQFKTWKFNEFMDYVQKNGTH